ncbi:unnamed protein product, partial [Rotaria magnacalcarata]
NIDWSFSSDEYQPPSLEELYPHERISSQERADFELVTHGRLDYFCQKYLFLTNVTEVRKFQHYAQVEMTMHKEHFYEFMRFVRHQSDLLNEIQEIAKEMQNEENCKKQAYLIDGLIKIRKKSNFVNVGYEPKYTDEFLLSDINFLDLPNEMLLIILKKLDNIDVLYSLFGINNKRLDILVQDDEFTNNRNFVTTSSITDDEKFDRFSTSILP